MRLVPRGLGLLGDLGVLALVGGDCFAQPAVELLKEPDRLVLRKPLRMRPLAILLGKRGVRLQALGKLYPVK